MLAESASAVFTTAGAEEDVRAQASSSSSYAVPMQPASINIESFIDEVHLPFQMLLREVPDPEAHGTLAAFPRLQPLQQQTVSASSANSTSGQLLESNGASGISGTAWRSSEDQESAGAGQVMRLQVWLRPCRLGLLSSLL